MVFAEIAEAGSVTRAAEALSLSKSAVSGHLARLENACGARLFERTTRKLVLTQAGDSLLPQALTIRRAWREGLELLEAQRTEPSGTLKVTCPSLLAGFPVATVLERYSQAYPKVDVSVLVSDTIVDIIEQGIDVALRTGFLPDAELVSRRIGVMREVVVAAPALLKKEAKLNGPEQLALWNWLQHTGRPHHCVFSGPAGREFNFTITGSITVNDAKALREMAIAGVGLAILPDLAVRNEIAAKQLVDVLPGWTCGTVPLHAVFPSKAHRTPRVSRFVDILVPLFKLRDC